MGIFANYKNLKVSVYFQASKKDESKSAATSKDSASQSAANVNSGGTGSGTEEVASLEATKMSVRHEFQAKIQELIAGESKPSSSEKTSAEATAASPAPSADAADAAAATESDSSQTPIIHSEPSLSNSNSHEEEDDKSSIVPDAAAAAAEEPAKTIEAKDQTTSAAPAAEQGMVTPVKAKDAAGSISNIEGLEPVSPAPLPETPSTKKDIGGRSTWLV